MSTRASHAAAGASDCELCAERRISRPHLSFSRRDESLAVTVFYEYSLLVQRGREAHPRRNNPRRERERETYIYIDNNAEDGENVFYVCFFPSRTKNLIDNRRRRDGWKYHAMCNHVRSGARDFLICEKGIVARAFCSVKQSHSLFSRLGKLSRSNLCI